MRQLPIDQTLESWRNQVGEGDLGTGIFLVRQGGGYSKMVVPDIKYEDVSNELAKEREFIAFKWIPHVIAATPDIKRALNRRCGGGRCRQTCVRVGCICINGHCQ